MNTPTSSEGTTAGTALDFEGHSIPVAPGDTVASALYRAGVRTFSRSFKYHRKRGLYCLTGDCPNCLMTVDGEPAVRTCCTPAAGVRQVARGSGWPSADHDALSILWRLRKFLPVGFYYKSMIRPRGLWPLAERVIRRIAGLGPIARDLPVANRERLNHHPDLLVIGGGVAGLAAALTAAERGERVVLADEGKIGEAIAAGTTRSRIDELRTRLSRHPTVEILEQALTVGIYQGPLVPIAGREFLHLVHPGRIVVATGAVERHPVFTGSDLPGIWLGRGAARLAGVHGLSPGRRIVVVVANAEGLAHLAVLRERGTRHGDSTVVAVVAPGGLAEQVPPGLEVIGDGTVVAALGRGALRAVVVQTSAGRHTIACDALVFSLGLQPRDGLLRQAVIEPVLGAGDVINPGCTIAEAEAAGSAAATVGGKRGLVAVDGERPQSLNTPAPTASLPPVPTASLPPARTASLPPARTARLPPAPTASLPPVPTASQPPALTTNLPLVPTANLPLVPTANLPLAPTASLPPVATANLPPMPTDGFVCLCEDIEIGELTQAWHEGYRSTELLKRYTTVTMGACQGALCHSHLRAFVGARSQDQQVSRATVARPPARPVRLEDLAAGVRVPLEYHTALHDRHLARGASMEWTGAWKRPSNYGDVEKEYWAVRKHVSVMDVSTLGKYHIAGPDALQLLDRLYPCHVADLQPWRSRYTLLLNEAGYIFDDGLVCSLGESGFYATFTSSGADAAESWLREWAEEWGLTVHIANLTAARSAINVAGPRTRELLAKLSGDPIDAQAIPYGGLREITVAGIPCRAIRVGFVGELSIELHHPSRQSAALWDALLKAGAEFEIQPHGLDALKLLRLEKGHFIIGLDTDFDSTPAKVGADWTVKMDKPTFVGRTALERIARIPRERSLLPLTFAGRRAPEEGAQLFFEDSHVGNITSSRFSPVLGMAVALGWVRHPEGAPPTRITARDTLGELAGAVTKAPFYDPRGERLRA